MWDTYEWVGALEPPHAHLSFDQWGSYEWVGAMEPEGGLVSSFQPAWAHRSNQVVL